MLLDRNYIMFLYTFIDYLGFYLNNNVVFIVLFNYLFENYVVIYVRG